MCSVVACRPDLLDQIFGHFKLVDSTVTHFALVQSLKSLPFCDLHSKLSSKLTLEICVYVYMCVCVCVCVCVSLQGGEDAKDALSCRSLFAKEPLIIGLFCEK